MMKFKFLGLAIILSITLPVFGQSDSDNYITMAPGPEYEAGWLHRIFFGDHWRDLWTTPVRVKVLDLDTFAGGLIPLKKGGGMQTKSLRFKGRDGRFWKFRSISKDPSKVLPKELRVALVKDVIQDQISWSNPLAPLVVTPFLNAVSVLQAEPELVYLPDDEKLGDFREEFAGLLGMIEIHPDETNPGFYDAEKVVGTFKLFERLEKKRGEKVSSIEFLKARLMDVYLGDWDRHTDQWRWARFTNDNDKLWYPIPRDRDQAFAKFDGILVRIAEYLVPQFTHFGEDYPQIEDLTWSGRFLDRRFLTELDKNVWDSVATYAKNQITDDLIEYSVKRLPEEHFKIAGEELIYKLKSRRDKLLEASDEFYYRLNKYADVYCSDENDYAEIIRLNDDQTEISIYKKSKKGEKNERLYHKIFDNNITQEIRVYLNEGRDKAVIKGEVDSGPIIRVIGGKGKDELIDESLVRGYFLHITPLPYPERINYLHDYGDNTLFSPSPSSVIDTKYFPQPETPEERYEPQQRDRGHEWLFLPYSTINPDDGLVIGGGVNLASYDFRKTPFDYSMSLMGKYATLPGSYAIEFNGEFNSVFDNTDMFLRLSHTELSFNKYYGYGNETSYNSDLEANDYYRLSQELVEIYPRLIIHLPGDTNFEMGISYTSSSLTLNNRELLNNFPRRGYGMGSMQRLGLHSSVYIDTRDNISFPLSGNYFKTGVSYFPGLLDINTHYGQIRYDFRTYYSFNWISDMTIALRTGGGTTIGDFPFWGAMFLGGEDNLRGYNRERFSGKSAIFGQLELRSHLTDATLIIKGRMGIHLFGELGRVFLRNDRSSKWHPSYGAGIWMSFLDRTFNVSATLALSPETIAVYAGTSFGL